ESTLGGRERIASLANQDLVLDRLLVEPDSELAAILLRLANRVVVHLEADVLPGRDAFPGVRAVDVDAASRHIGQQFGGARKPELRAHLVVAARAALRQDQSAVLVECGALWKIVEVHASVMDHGAVARSELDDLSEPVFTPGHLDVEIRDRK